MSQFQVDATTGALVRENGSFVRVGGLEEVAQHVRVRLRLIRGEVPSNLTLGIRYEGFLLVKGTAPEAREQELSDTIAGTPGVLTVDEIASILDDATRELVVTFASTIALDDARRRIPLHDRFSISLAV